MRSVSYKYFQNFPLELENGMVMYDSLSKSELFVQCPVICISADNPRASEFCHHLGSSAKKFCRFCDVRVTLCMCTHYSIIQ